MHLADYVCLECGETFDTRSQAIIHHIMTNHENFQLIGSDLKVHVKKTGGK